MDITVSSMRVQGKSHQYPLHRRLGGPLNKSGHFGEVKNLLSLPGIEPQIVNPVA